MMEKQVNAIVTKGHGVASGQARDSPYPNGTIAMQLPFFKALGLDLSDFHLGTLNLSVTPKTFKMLAAEYCFNQVAWVEGFPAEDFSFSRCHIIFGGKSFKGYIYYPHPETKIGHFHSSSLIEVVAEPIPDIKYGDKVILKYDDCEVSLFD